MADKFSYTGTGIDARRQDTMSLEKNQSALQFHHDDVRMLLRNASVPMEFNQSVQGVPIRGYHCLYPRMRTPWLVRLICLFMKQCAMIYRFVHSIGKTNTAVLFNRRDGQLGWV